MISSTVALQMNGLGFWFQACRNASMARFSSGTLTKLPRRIAFSVNSRNQRSTKFSQLELVGTHKEPHVQAWLKKHPRFVCHFVPTSSSWLNLVERWFRELTEKAIRRGSFVSVPELNRAIEAFLQAWNQNPKPFIWSATVEEIIKKIDRARAKMEQIKPGSTQPAGKEKGLPL